MDSRLFLSEGELDRSVGLLLAAGRKLRRAGRRGRTEAGLSEAEAEVLLILRHQPGLTVGRVRVQSAMTPPTFARLLARLSERGLVERRACQADQRQKRVFLSPAGEAALSGLLADLRNEVRRAFRSAKPSDVTGAKLLLEALAQ